MSLPSTIFLPVFALLVGSLAGCASVRPGGNSPDDEATAILRQSSETLAAADSFSFRVVRDVPEVIAKAAGMKRKADIRVAVSRPGKVRGTSGGGGSERRFYYDGRSVTVYDSALNATAVEWAPRNIDRMVAFIDYEWSIRPPMAGLLLRRPFSKIIVDGPRGTLAGTETIRGETCDHLHFSAPEVEWDLWISRADKLPKRFDVTFKNVEGSPRGRTEIKEWDLNRQFPPGYFEPQVPEGTRKVALEKLQ